MGNSKYDLAASAGRGIASMVPMVGGFLGEIITHLIPNQRIDRVERYLRHLSARLDHLPHDKTDNIAKSPERVALFEDGAILASRAISQDRIERIACLVGEGLSEEEAEAARWRRMLDLVAQLDDQELAILAAYASRQNTWEALARLRPPPLYIGSDIKTSQENALWSASLAKLERLSLLSFRPETETVDTFKTVPLYDNFGQPKGFYDITRFGRSFLKALNFSVEVE